MISSAIVLKLLECTVPGFSAHVFYDKGALHGKELPRK